MRSPRLLKAEYEGIVSSTWIRIHVKISDGREGNLLFEIDGRDVEGEGIEVDSSLVDLLHTDEANSMLEPELAEGVRVAQKFYGP